MRTPPDVSDEEIHAMMDFDAVLARRHTAKKTRGNWKFIAPAIVALVVVTWMMWEQSESETQISQPVVEKTPVQTPQIVPEPVQEKVEITRKPVEARPQASKVSPKETATSSNTVADVYTEAEPLNGYPDLYNYFQKELTYPAEAKKDSIEGIVSVSFVINRNGKPEQIRILNSLGVAFDNEVIRVISGMPEWKPASLNGKPMPAKISMPLTFQVNRTSKP